MEMAYGKIGGKDIDIFPGFVYTYINYGDNSPCSWLFGKSPVSFHLDLTTSSGIKNVAEAGGRELRRCGNAILKRKTQPIRLSKDR